MKKNLLIVFTIFIVTAFVLSGCKNTTVKIDDSTKYIAYFSPYTSSMYSKVAAKFMTIDKDGEMVFKPAGTLEGQICRYENDVMYINNVSIMLTRDGKNFKEYKTSIGVGSIYEDSVGYLEKHNAFYAGFNGGQSEDGYRTYMCLLDLKGDAIKEDLLLDENYVGVCDDEEKIYVLLQNNDTPDKWSLMTYSYENNGLQREIIDLSQINKSEYRYIFPRLYVYGDSLYLYNMKMEGDNNKDVNAMLVEINKHTGELIAETSVHFYKKGYGTSNYYSVIKGDAVRDGYMYFVDTLGDIYRVNLNTKQVEKTFNCLNGENMYPNIVKLTDYGFAAALEDEANGIHYFYKYDVNGNVTDKTQIKFKGEPWKAENVYIHDFEAM